MARELASCLDRPEHFQTSIDARHIVHDTTVPVTATEATLSTQHRMHREHHRGQWRAGHRQQRSNRQIRKAEWCVPSKSDQAIASRRQFPTAGLDPERAADEQSGCSALVEGKSTALARERIDWRRDAMLDCRHVLPDALIVERAAINATRINSAITKPVSQDGRGKVDGRRFAWGFHSSVAPSSRTSQTLLDASPGAEVSSLCEGIPATTNRSSRISVLLWIRC